MSRFVLNHHWLIWALTASLTAGLLSAGPASAQSFRHGGTEFDAVRHVTVPLEKAYTIVVVDFLHHGEIRPGGGNVAVAARNHEIVPLRILQLGPGDFCRLAFETAKGQWDYDIFYGGEPPKTGPPAWSCRDGLLLETRRFRRCDFWSDESLRRAFDAAEPIGADYVDGVFHACNPLSVKHGPFLSRYTGVMDLKNAGTYGLITSSQDCSFLRIDGRVVASAPGYHGPIYRALPWSRHDVKLSAGEHSFEYDHAASGPNAMMVADWEVDPPKTGQGRPAVIPGEVFHAYAVGHLPAGTVSLRTVKHMPDFSVAITGEVPLPDRDVPLIGVRFYDKSPKSLVMQGAKIRWDFGDGQTSDLESPEHVYLRPGLYAVKLSVRRGGRPIEITNHIEVGHPPVGLHGDLPALDDYLRIIETYDPKTLDAPSLLQMVLTLEAKSLALAGQVEDAGARAKAAEAVAAHRPESKRKSPAAKKAASHETGSESDRYLAKAVAAGRAAFADDSAAKGDGDLLHLAELIGSMARTRLGDSRTALEIWRGAARRVTAGGTKAPCEIAAAEVAVNDLLEPAAARPLLDSATRGIGRSGRGAVAARLERVWGDYYAATGDGPAARQAYRAAGELADTSRPLAERTARLGAHARSTEEFIRGRQFARAAEEMQAWQEQFPAAKLDGYLTLLLARYWSGRGRPVQAIAQAEQLHTANPDSPYADQALYLAAQSQMRLGHRDLARATLQAILKEYPGSPLVPKVTKNIETLEDGEKKE